MKKLKIDKIKLADLSKEEQNNVVGGEQVGVTVTVTVLTVAVAVGPAVTYSRACATQDQLTCKPGHQDSCGLCTTNYAC